MDGLCKYYNASCDGEFLKLHQILIIYVLYKGQSLILILEL